MKRPLQFLVLVVAAGIMAAGFTTCTENPKDGNITVNPSKLEFTAEGDTKTVNVTGNNWQAVPSADWITVVKSADSFTVAVGANDTEEPRSGSVTVSNADDSKTVTVTQAGAEAADTSLNVTPDKLNISAEGDTKTVTVTSELPWEATPSDEWITVVKSEGSFTVTVGVNVTTEERSGSVTVDNGGNSKTVTVKQAAAGVIDPSLDVDTEVLTFGAEDASAQTVTVTSLREWNAITEDAWINIVKGDGTFAVTVNAADLYEPRTGTITVANDTNSATITVTQAGLIDPILEVDVEELALGASGEESYIVNVTSLREWNAVPNDAWINVEKGNGKFTITVAPNTTYDSRRGTITVSNDTNSATVTVNQEGLTFWYVEEIELDVTTATLDINDTLQLTATIYPDNATNPVLDWKSTDNAVATVSNTGFVTAVGAGNATITVTAADGSNVSASCAVTVNEDETETPPYTRNVKFKHISSIRVTNPAGGSYYVQQTRFTPYDGEPDGPGAILYIEYTTNASVLTNRGFNATITNIARFISGTDTAVGRVFCDNSYVDIYGAGGEFLRRENIAAGAEGNVYKIGPGNVGVNVTELKLTLDQGSVLIGTGSEMTFDISNNY